MAGGSGTRFWPESTSKQPKQYLNLIDDRSLLQSTISRFDNFIERDNRFIVTVKSQEDLVKRDSKGGIGSNGVIFEPEGKNTAPCILLSLAHLINEGALDRDVVAIVPADHVILNRGGFVKVLDGAIKKASELQKIVTIGITPTIPHTGYGYIKKGDEVESEGLNFFTVDGFREKPDLKTAAAYLSSGEYLWNAGMFVAPIGVLLKEFKVHAPDIYHYYKDLYSSISDFDKVKSIYGQIPANSIDYAIMEKSNEIIVTPSLFDWNDLGSWDALEQVLEKKDDNYIVSDNGHKFLNSKNNIIFAPSKFVSLINVDDLVIVSNDNVVMVVPKKDSQEIKQMVNELKGIGSELT